MSTPETPSSDAAAPDALDAAVVDVGRGSARHAARRRGSPLLLGLAVAVVALLGMQLYLALRLGETNDELRRLRTEVAALDAAVDAVAAAGASRADVSSSSDGLPPLPEGGPDPAVGARLGPIAGPEYYTDAELRIDPADGVRRVWLVWAHWCPFCQKELPELDGWYPTADLEGMELVSITTSIDPSRGNPLEPYLDDLALPFPVVVDEDLSLARRLGVTAFPFWVVTDGDGTVLFRTAGYLPADQVERLFARLAEFG
ncbi:MAG TPA: TlpA family protein disulfide reductase [Actinobacteria bacterium]|nr:TlpA family protein disulfide reductase [Actinomycetota bacterium]